MTKGNRANLRRGVAATALFGLAAPALAVPWILYADAQSASVCDVINATNGEFVVLESTGQLVYVTELDWPLIDAFVDAEGFVYFQDSPAGFIEFATDGGGLRTLWWFYDFDNLANVNTITGQPTPTGLTPAVFFNVSCDACDFWDIPADCADRDSDGIDDRFDLCPWTPLDEIADADGCSCSQLDGDEDGVNDCFDLCPFTSADDPVDLDGCSCSELDSDQDGVGDCDDLCPGTPQNDFVDPDGCSCDLSDTDLDGINDCFDWCPGTSVLEQVDVDGCACSQLDSDLDGVNNCFDLCPGTPLTAEVDNVGCEPLAPSPPGTVVNICGSGGAMIFSLMFLGLMGFRLNTRRL